MATAENIADGLPDKVCLFLGAGASKAVGLPVMNEFFEKALGDPHFSTNIGADLQYHFGAKDAEQQMQNRKTLLYLIVRAAYLGERQVPKVYDLEQVWGFIREIESLVRGDRLDVTKHLFFLLQCCTSSTQLDLPRFRKDCGGVGKQIGRVSEEIEGAVDSLRSKIHDVFGGAYGTRTATEAGKMYMPFLSAVTAYTGSIPVFTTNYDSIFEGMHERGCLEPWNLVDGTARGRDAIGWDVRNYEDQLSYPKRLFYFKLHGSLTWTFDEDGKKVVHRPLTESMPDRPVILYPVESHKDSEREPFLGLRQIFSKYLTRAKCCVVVGFSFRDNYLRDLFRSALQNRQEFRLVSISPLPPEDARYIDDNVSKMIADFGEKRVCRIARKFGEPEVLVELKNLLDA